MQVAEEYSGFVYVSPFQLLGQLFFLHSTTPDLCPFLLSLSCSVKFGFDEFDSPLEVPITMAFVIGLVVVIVDEVTVEVFGREVGI